ncbi:MAG: N-acetyl-1-D-myo-inositol-2-amino-2-deoxy-alpha-D-glucopyranoside deacetylase [Mycobacteriales bacterium]|nr:N-acetyl-1-D-myo-inositol-2-amino-2-deoxy-alpha-D-glucopyranoside deacetylase [Frankia sp.]
MTLTAERRLLLVHAHPDDETIGTGVTMARYADEGAHVCLVTCTLGEEGEIVVDDLETLRSNGENKLGDHRVGELAAACELLGVTDHRWLGGEGRWRDSGMMGEPTNDEPTCFWQADLDVAAGELVRVIREVRPQVVVTYDEEGAYGHPDHIQAHRVTVAAVEAAGDAARYPDAGPPWTPAKLYYTAIPKSVLAEGFEYFKATGDSFFADVESPEGMPFGVDDAVVTTCVAAPELTDRKMAAMHAHRSQIAAGSLFFALPPDIERTAWGHEYYILVRGERGPAGRPDGREADLFAGL